MTDPGWWRGAAIYQVYPRSFQDSNDDGLGDLPGVTRRLDHIASLGVDAVWISPFFKSPMADMGYDVSDYRDVDPMFGTLADFDALLARAHDLGLRVIIDQVLNHTSDQHAWFKESRGDRLNSKAAGMQVADGDDVVGLAAIVDASGNQLNGNSRSVAILQLRLSRLALQAGRVGCGVFVEELAQFHAGQHCCQRPGQLAHAVIGTDDAVAVADDQALHGGIGQAVHAVDLELLATEAQIYPPRGCRQHQDHQRGGCGRERLRGRLDRVFGYDDRGIGKDRDGTHADEMQGADCQRQHRGQCKYRRQTHLSQCVGNVLAKGLHGVLPSGLAENGLSPSISYAGRLRMVPLDH